MTDWREKILSKILVEDSRLVVLLDPDNILIDLLIYEQLKKNGFFILSYNDPVSFRLQYESSFRAKWDLGEKTDLRLLIRTSFASKSQIPFDLQQDGKIVKIGFEDIIRYLNRTVVEALGPGYFDALCQVTDGLSGTRLSESKTKELILSKIFDIIPDKIRTPTDLFLVLFRVHYNNIAIPEILTDFIVERLYANEEFKYPIKNLFNRKFFVDFVQENWFCFLKAIDENAPVLIPFDHPSLKPYITTFFIEGYLDPIIVPEYEKLPEWTWTGIIIDQQTDVKRKLTDLLKQIGSDLACIEPTYTAWQKMGWKWSEAIYLKHLAGNLNGERTDPDFEIIHTKIETSFQNWLIPYFRNLPTLSYIPKPVMVHHIPHYIASQHSRQKIALIVFDGMALHQWFILRDVLKKSFELTEDGIFAWVPTLTSISRRAIFSGEKPGNLKTALQDYGSEKRCWKEFWVARGYRNDDIGYVKGITLQESSELEEIQKFSNKKILGMVVNTIDNSLKNPETSTTDLLTSIKRWVDKGLVTKMIQDLKDEGYSIFLTSDHGNVSCRGTGYIQEGILTEEKSLRARVYDNHHLADVAVKKSSDAIRWPDEYLGNTYSVLLSQGLTSFNNNGDMSISHGGISLEEVIVPFIQVVGEK